jgi:hypothetical protein
MVPSLALKPLHHRDNIVELDRSMDIVKHIRPYDVLSASPDTGAFMQKRPSCFSMRKHDYSAHNWSHRVGIHDSFPCARHEESSFASLEFVIQIDQERKEGGLAGVLWRGVVDVGFCYWVNS